MKTIAKRSFFRQIAIFGDTIYRRRQSEDGWKSKENVQNSSLSYNSD